LRTFSLFALGHEAMEGCLWRHRRFHRGIHRRRKVEGERLEARGDVLRTGGSLELCPGNHKRRRRRALSSTSPERSRKREETSLMSQPPYRSYLSRSIKGKTALITGAASGMGRATAHLFAREGAKVAVTDLKQDAVDAVVEEIKAAGIDHVKGWAMDVSDAAAIKRVIDEAAAHFGGLEILVNNAGFAIPANIA
jgi:hypothetical protein